MESIRSHVCLNSLLTFPASQLRRWPIQEQKLTKLSNSYNKYLSVAARVVRRSLKDDKRLAAERRGEMELRFAKWNVSALGGGIFDWTLTDGAMVLERKARREQECCRCERCIDGRSWHAIIIDVELRCRGWMAQTASGGSFCGMSSRRGLYIVSFDALRAQQFENQSTGMLGALI